MEAKGIKILVVEDEAIIAEDLKFSLMELGYGVVGTCSSYEEAMAHIEQERPDFLILDIIIDGPRDGIALAADVGMKFDIPFIFLTSHADKATVKRAASVKPNGYLLKPFRQNELYSAIEVGLSNYASKAEAVPGEKLQAKLESLAMSDSFFVRDKYAYIKIVFHDILYIKADSNYIRIFTESSNHIIRGSLKDTLEVLPQELFLKVHRSYVVNLKHISAIHPSEIHVGSEKIPVKKEQREELLQLIQTL